VPASTEGSVGTVNSGAALTAWLVKRRAPPALVSGESLTLWLPFRPSFQVALTCPSASLCTTAAVVRVPPPSMISHLTDSPARGLP